MNQTIQGLWIGPELSVMEQLSIASFLQNGHEYDLYVYDELKNVPRSAAVKDANEILPSSKIFQYSEQRSYAGFANFFRYKLLLERGGWWADTDLICVKRFDFPEEYVFGSEMDRGSQVITSGIIKAPPGSDVMAYAWDICQNKNPAELKWGETGPRLMGEAVRRFSLDRHVKSHNVFCPLAFDEWQKLIEPGSAVREDRDVYAIHLWNEKWRAAGQDKNATYPEDCLYEKLKRRYLPVDLSVHSGTKKP